MWGISILSHPALHFVQNRKEVALMWSQFTFPPHWREHIRSRQGAYIVLAVMAGLWIWLAIEVTFSDL